MNESSNPKPMYEAVPAVAELNKVPGFDPLKFLRRTKDSMRLPKQNARLNGRPSRQKKSGPCRSRWTALPL